MNRALQKICLATFCLTIISSLVLAQKVPHSFEEGGIISAEQMNDNFLVAASKLRKGTVDCTDASPENHDNITEKLKDYNYLVINGVCTENVIIDFMNRDVPDNWEWDNMTAFTSMVLLIGTPDDGVVDGITAVDQGARVIDIDGPVAVGLKDLTISGGEGIRGQFGAMIGLQRVTVNNSSKDGLRITRGMGFVNDSTFNTNESGITAEYNSTLEVLSSEILYSNDFGIRVTEGSNALVGREPDYDSNDDPDFSSSQGNQIRGGRHGVIVADASFLRMMGNEVSCYTNTGVYAGETSTLDLGMFFENAEIDDGPSHPLHPDNPAYNTNKLYYGNLIDGAECNGEPRRDWHHGIQVREASALRMYRTIIKNNVQHGVYSEGNSSITLGGGNEIKDNGRHGFSLRETTLNQWSGQQELEPSVVTGNGEDAFDLSSSVIHLRGGKIWDEFTGEEIQASENRRFVISGHRHGISARNSRITLERVDIENNDDAGVRVTDNSVLNIWRDGATITGNGLNTDDWDGYAPGLRIDKNSTASIDRLEVSGNGRGILVERGSVIDGGWKDENDTTLPDYMITIKDNKLWGLEINKGSTLNLRNLEVSGNSKTQEPNENGTYYTNAIRIGDGSVGDLRDSLITENGGRAIHIEGNSRLDMRNLTISNNGLLKQTDENGGSFYKGTIRVSEGSSGQLRSATVTSNGGSTIDIRNNSKFNIRDTTITGNGLSDGSGDFSFRGIQVLNHSHLDFDDSTLTHNTQDHALEIAHYSIGHINNVNITNTEGRAFNAWELSDANFNNGSINSSENDCIGIGKSKTNFNQMPITTGGFCIGTDADVYFSNSELNITNGNLFTEKSVVNFDNIGHRFSQAINIRNNSNVSFRNGTTLNAGSGDGNLQIDRSDVEIRDLNLANLNISGGSVNLHDAIINNEQGHALYIGGGADVNFQRGSIRESDATCISIGGAKAHFNEVPITTGGFCINSDSDVYIGSGSVTLTNGNLFANDSKLNMNNLTLSTTVGGVDINDGSKAWFDNVTVQTDQKISINNRSQLELSNSSVTSSNQYNGINLNDESYIGIRNSTINATGQFTDDNNNPNGSNAVQAYGNSRVNIHWDSQSNTVINAGAFPLKANGSKIEIMSPVQLLSVVDFHHIWIEEGSQLNLGGPSDIPVQTIGKIGLAAETRNNLSDRWNIGEVYCWNHFDINNAPIYRKAVIYRNGSATTSISSDCITAN